MFLLLIGLVILLIGAFTNRVVMLVGAGIALIGLVLWVAAAPGPWAYP